MKSGFSKTRIIYIARKANLLNYYHALEKFLICRNKCYEFGVYMFAAHFIFIIMLIYFFHVPLN
jgi:hypothetical protein